jgi:hypothetical protein
MKKTIDFSDFRDAFQRIGRNDQFSPEGLEVLFNYLEGYEQDTGEELELDVIALCCDYSEDHWEDVAANYSIDLTGCEDEDEKIDAVRDHLSDNTTLVGEPLFGSFVYVNF